jgi:hypothetical protein
MTTIATDARRNEGTSASESLQWSATLADHGPYIVTNTLEIRPNVLTG